MKIRASHAWQGKVVCRTTHAAEGELIRVLLLLFLILSIAIVGPAFPCLSNRKLCFELLTGAFSFNLKTYYLLGLLRSGPGDFVVGFL